MDLVNNRSTLVNTTLNSNEETTSYKLTNFDETVDR